MNLQPFLALEASAGSGKTFALSVRFVALVLKGAKTGEIFALTFSKKATNEMKERIIGTFLNLEHKEAELNELCKLLGKEKHEILELRDRFKQEFLRSDLKIFTFDSFFAKILRAFSLNLGLMSDFEITEGELDAKALFIKALSQNELFNLAFYIKNVDEHFLQDLNVLYKNAFKDEVQSANMPSLDAVKAAFNELKDYTLGASSNKTLAKNFNLKLEPSSLKDLCNKPIIKNLNIDYLKNFIHDEIFLQKQNALITAINAYTNALEAFKIAQIQSLLDKYKATKALQHKTLNTLKFDDITLYVYELSRQEGFNELVYFRLDAQISHLLIDEFQDTSSMQYEILKPLIAELVSGKGAKSWRTFFYVGDKKQSIYRFRGSKKELFDKLLQDFPQIKLDKMDTNYRSTALLTNFVNELFAPKYKGYKPQKSVRNGGFIKVKTSEQPINKKTESIKESMFEAVLTELEFLKQKGANLDDTAILCHKSSEADELVAFLKEKKFKAYTQSSKLLEKKASVCALLEYAKYCIFGDSLYLEHVKALLNPASVIEREQLARAKGETIELNELFVPKRLNLRLHENPAQICLYLVQKLELDLAENALLQYLEYARTKENFLELLFSSCEQKIANDENTGISVMTIFKSKGLEFENVIVLDEISRPDDDKSHLLLEIDLQKGMQLKIKDKIREATKEAGFCEFMQKRAQGALENDINALYVAFTRAKDALFVIKKPLCDKNSRVRDYFDDEKYLRLECFEKGEIKPNESTQKSAQECEKTLELEKVPPQKAEKSIAPNSEAIIFGEAFHYLMQHLNLKDFSNLNALKERVFACFHHFLDKNSLEEVFLRAQRLAKEPKFRALLADKEYFKEQPLSFEGQIKQLDLLCVSEHEALIIDYKSGEQGFSEHEAQVKSYKKAVETILKKPHTRAVLIYALKDEIKFIEI